jgi:hypothetical protein
MAKKPWARSDRLMRALHLYTSMFLVPWMMVYAISAFCLNHSEWFTETLQLKQDWDILEESDFAPGAAFPDEPKAQARAILQEVDLDGAHRIGSDDPNQMIIYRNCATGLYRVDWQRQASRLVVRKQRPCSFYSFVNALHFQHGYFKPDAVNLPWLIWGIIVDAVTISTVLWVITGIYIWARRRRKRLPGGLCLVAGGVLFAVLAILMCG